MKNLGTISAAVFVALVLLGYMCTFQVRFTEVAIKKTFGKLTEGAITTPGPKFKWPPPIQTVVIYDKRIRLLEDRTEETRTVDSKNVILTTFTLWRITDPSLFHTNFPGGVEDGEKKLRTTVVAHKLATVGQRRFDEFISTDPAKRHIREIEQDIERQVAADAVDYGMEVVDFGIKKLALPEAVTSSIFQSMKSHEEAKAADYEAEGEARANDILADARAKRERILAAARARVAEIEANAERVVSGFYREFDEHPRLRILLDTLRTVAHALQERTTLVITTKQTPFDIFREDVRRALPLDEAAAPRRSGELSTRTNSAEGAD